MTAIQKEDSNILLSIIIVNYNGKHHLKGCLDSLRNHLIGVNAEVILVDNASVDGSVNYIKDKYPWVNLIQSATNKGFTGGNNLGAMAAKGQYLLLLNNDTVTESSFKPMLDILEMNPHVGVVGCMLQYGDGRLQESIGHEHTPLSIPLSWMGLGGWFTKNHFLSRTFHSSSLIYSSSFAECAWISGACLLTRRDLWARIGGLDEAYFMYVEDVDYCRSVRALGYKIVYTQDVLITHYEGGGRVWIGERALLNTINSYEIYSGKFFSKSGACVMRGGLATVFFLRSVLYKILSLVKKNDVMKDKSLAYFRGSRNLIVVNK